MVYILPFLSVILGYATAFIFPKKNKKYLKLLLAFSGSFLLTLTVTHLLPEIYMYELEDALHHHNHDHSHHHHDHSAMGKVGMWIMVGIVLQIVLEYFSKGAEHGHTHSHNKIKTMPWLLFISLSLHALFEGMPLSEHKEMALGIAIHHYPIAIILSLFFFQSGLSKQNTFLFMMLFSLSTPLGTFVADNIEFLKNYYVEVSSLVVGILFHISSTIIFESSEGHKFNVAKLTSIIIGILMGVLMNF